MKKNKSFVSLFNRKSMTLSAAAYSDVGSVRENNEDNYLLGSHCNTDSTDHSEACIVPRRIGEGFIAAVFDGMGGGEAGELASKAAAEALREAMEKENLPVGKKEMDAAVRAAFAEANRKVVAIQGEGHICGSTGTVLAICEGAAKIFHLGDSRAYLRREDSLFQLSRDQTLAQMKIEMGIYDSDDPRSEAEKHQLTDYIGRDKSGSALRPEESEWIALQRGDRFLLCSDGLYDVCSDEEIVGVLALGDARAAAGALVEKTLKKGAIDNVTSIVVELK